MIKVEKFEPLLKHFEEIVREHQEKVSCTTHADSTDFQDVADLKKKIDSTRNKLINMFEGEVPVHCDICKKVILNYDGGIRLCSDPECQYHS